MRITRSRIFKLKQVSKKSLFVTSAAVFTFTSLLISNVVLQPTKHAAAATSPESCFAFDSAAGAITNYYDSQNNDSAQIACPRDVEIPASIGGIPITTISASAFAQKGITSVAIPTSIVTIDSFAFYNNQLTHVTIPGSVTTLGSNAFSSNNLATVTLPSSLTAISDYAFSSNMLTSITIPGTISAIGEFAFQDNQLSSLAIPNTVRSIGSYAFGSNRLSSLTIPNSITDIPQGAFQNNLLTTVVLPSTVTSIGNAAFSRNRMESVVIPASVSTIGLGAFGFQSIYGPSLVSDLIRGDQTKKQAAYDSLFFARLVLLDHLNPYSYQDDVQAFGAGYLVDAYPITLSFHDSNGNSLQANIIRTGDLGNGTFLSDYFLSKSIPRDTSSVQIYASQETINAGSNAYYRLGQSISVIPPFIAGYATPSSKTVIVGEGNNLIDFVYTPAVTQVSFHTNSIESGALIPSGAPVAISSALIKSSILAITNTDSTASVGCSTIQSAHLLAPNTISSPTADITLLGGLNFTLKCTAGAETKVVYTLGTTVSDIAKLRVYKHNSTTNKTDDITSQTIITNTNGKTVISYHLIDGGIMDEDGQVNGQIMDPIYVGLENDASELASTGVSVKTLGLSAVSVVAASAALCLYLIKRAKYSKETY